MTDNDMNMVSPENMYPTDALSLTKILVGIPSTNPGDYETEIGEYICKWLEFHEIRYKKEEVLAHRYNIMAYLSDSGHLKNTGCSLPPYSELIYICHMDTVVKGSGWIKPAFQATAEKDRLYGLGACDMKSGLACAMSSLYFLKKHNSDMNFPFKLIFTVDEEDDMRGVEKCISSGWVNERSLVLDTEPTDNMIQVAHKGRVWIKLDLFGITAHASRPHMGCDAIAAICEFISRFRKEIEEMPKHEELGSNTVTFGQIEGGYRPYVVPDKASVWMDIRTVPPLDSDMIEKKLEEALIHLKSSFPKIRAKYEFTGNRPYIEKDPNSFLLNELKSVCEEVLGQPQQVSFFTGYTDTAVIAGKLNNKNCMSYGPGSLDMAHKPDEYVPTEDIIRCEKVLASLAQKICM